MLLFQHNGEPILFHLINIEDAERAALTHLIESEGGGVTDNDDVTVKFTSRDAYVRNGPLVRAKIYDVKFIEECIRQQKIVRPEDYRLGSRSGRDDYHVHHFLHGKCQDARYLVQCQCGRRHEMRVKTVSSQDNLGTSDASIGSPQVSDLRLCVSSLAGGDSPAIEDCATEDPGSPLNRDTEECRDAPRNWHEHPRRLSKVGRVPNIQEQSDDNSRNIDVPEQVAVPPLIPEPQMLTHDRTVVSPTASQNDHWIPARNKTTSNAQRMAESTDRETETPDLELVPATNNHPETARGSVHLANPFFRARRIRVEENIQEPEAQLDIAKKSSRGKEWRAKLKDQTAAQYTGTNSRMPFTLSERKTMLRYLIENKCIHRAKGLVVWKKMIVDGYLTDRTPQSLQNNFQKFILPNIEESTWLENSDRVKFLALRSNTKRGKNS